MKKVTIVAIAALLTIGAASSSFAEVLGQKAWSTTPGAVETIGSTGRPTLDLKPSTNVSIYIDSATYTGKTYVLATYHNKGTKVYGASSGDTKIYMTDIPAAGITGVTVPAAVADTSTSAVDWTGWTGQ